MSTQIPTQQIRPGSSGTPAPPNRQAPKSPQPGAKQQPAKNKRPFGTIIIPDNQEILRTELRKTIPDYAICTHTRFEQATSHHSEKIQVAKDFPCLVWSAEQAKLSAQAAMKNGFTKVFLVREMSLAQWLANAKENATDSHAVGDQFKELLRKTVKTIDVSLDKITDRKSTRIRQLDLGHVLDLAESISKESLRTPIIVDCRYHLVAGEHRLNAVRLLAIAPNERSRFLERLATKQTLKIRRQARASLEERAQALPHRSSPTITVSMLAIDAVRDPYGALTVEVGENARRKNYSPDEIRRLKSILEEQGYDFGLGRGRPNTGVKPGLPALKDLLGRCSDTTIRRALKDTPSPNAIATPQQRVWKSAYKMLDQFFKFPEVSNSVKVAARNFLEALNREPPVDQDVADDQ